MSQNFVLISKGYEGPLIIEKVEPGHSRKYILSESLRIRGE